MEVASELLSIARLAAREGGRAVIISGVLRFKPDSDALIIAPLRMAGEEHIWAIAYGRRGEEPGFVWAADPRNRDDATAHVFAPFAPVIHNYFEECASEGRAPQVWVASGSAVRFLDAVGDRRNSKDPSVALVARHFWFLSDRYAHFGQQVLIPAVEALTDHVATGQSAAEDQHLGALLAWVKPPRGKTAEEAALAEEESPAGVATDVERVDMKLERDLTDLAKIRRDGGSQRREEEIRKRVAELLRPGAERVYRLIEAAISALEHLRLPLAENIADLRREDQSAFEFYMRRNFIPTNWSDKESAQRLASREEIIDLASALSQRDGIGLLVARESGDVLEGEIVNMKRGRRRASVEEIELETIQAVSRLRRGDTLHIAGDKNIEVQLLRSNAPNGRGKRRMRFRVRHGKTFMDALGGETVQLVPGSGGGRPGMAKVLLKTAHDAKPWVLDRKGTIPKAAGGKPPADPLAALEALR